MGRARKPSSAAATATRASARVRGAAARALDTLDAGMQASLVAPPDERGLLAPSFVEPLAAPQCCPHCKGTGRRPAFMHVRDGAGDRFLCGAPASLFCDAAGVLAVPELRIAALVAETSSPRQGGSSTYLERTRARHTALAGTVAWLDALAPALLARFEVEGVCPGCQANARAALVSSALRLSRCEKGLTERAARAADASARRDTAATGFGHAGNSWAAVGATSSRTPEDPRQTRANARIEREDATTRGVASQEATPPASPRARGRRTAHSAVR